MIETSEQEFFSLDALRRKDPGEFNRLVEKYSNPLYRLGIKMLGNQQDAEDILQNTFLKAYQHIGTFEGRSSLSTWLYRIAANEALMILRRKRPETDFSDMASEEDADKVEPPAQFEDWCCLPDKELLSKEARKEMDRAVQSLPEGMRIVFILRDIEGLSIQETSQALDLTETAVKTRLLRARLRLREELSSYYSERIKMRRNE